MVLGLLIYIYKKFIIYKSPVRIKSITLGRVKMNDGNKRERRKIEQTS